MPMSRLPAILPVILSALLLGAAPAQAADEGKWADPADPVAQHLLDLERTWALMACDAAPGRLARAEAFYKDFIADDFVGTSPSGSLYTKADLVPAKPAPIEKDCRFAGAKVRFFGSDLAVLYGRESALRQGPGGKWARRTLIWTDTLRQRDGKWQAIAVQDMPAR